MSKVEDYVCEHVDIMKYYDNNIRVLNPERFKPSFKNSHLVVCPLHDDHDPSFGVIRDRTNRKIKIYHCFGCNRTGNIISLHQEIMRLQKGKRLSYRQAMEDLATKNNIDLTEFTEDEQDYSYKSSIKQQSENIDSILRSNRMSPREYTRGITKIRMQRDDGAGADEIAQALNGLDLLFKEGRFNIRR